MLLLPTFLRNQSPGREPEFDQVFQRDTPHRFPGKSCGWRLFLAITPEPSTARALLPPVLGGAGRSPAISGGLGGGPVANMLSLPLHLWERQLNARELYMAPSQIHPEGRPQTAMLTWADPALGWPRQRGSPETISQCRLS